MSGRHHHRITVRAQRYGKVWRGVVSICGQPHWHSAITADAARARELAGEHAAFLRNLVKENRRRRADSVKRPGRPA